MQFAERFQLELPTYEGPMALLLHLIMKEQVDIYDIEISGVIRRYLDYIHALNDLNIDVSGEFMEMAATLMEIKSYGLLPRPTSLDDLEDDGDDPKETLIQRLLAYKAFQSAAEEFQKRQLLGRDVFSSGTNESRETQLSLDLFSLIDAWDDVKSRRPKATYEITSDEVSIEMRIEFIKEKLVKSKKQLFHSLFNDDESSAVWIATFLALLELVKHQFISVINESGRYMIQIKG